MKILIADDEQPARRRMRRLLDAMPAYEIAGEARNGYEAVELSDQVNPDIVLMDIRMPGMDGLEAARHIAAKQNPPAIIFITAFADHALEAFETHAVDYLLKPVKAEKLQYSLEACTHLNRAQVRDKIGGVSVNETRRHICARVRGNLLLVPLEDIYFFQAEQKYVTVRHVGGEVLIEEPLKALELEFADEFYRIHRNALVRIDKIVGMDNNIQGHRLSITGVDEKLEVSRRHLPGVRKLLKSL